MTLSDRIHQIELKMNEFCKTNFESINRLIRLEETCLSRPYSEDKEIVDINTELELKVSPEQENSTAKISGERSTDPEEINCTINFK